MSVYKTKILCLAIYKYRPCLLLKTYVKLLSYYKNIKINKINWHIIKDVVTEPYFTSSPTSLPSANNKRNINNQEIFFHNSDFADDDHYFGDHLHFHDPFSEDGLHLQKINDVIPPHFGSIYSLSQLDNNHIDDYLNDAIEELMETFPEAKLNEREDVNYEYLDIKGDFESQRIKKSTPPNTYVSKPYTGVTPPGLSPTVTWPTLASSAPTLASPASTLATSTHIIVPIKQSLISTTYNPQQILEWEPTEGFKLVDKDKANTEKIEVDEGNLFLFYILLLFGLYNFITNLKI